MSASNNTLKAHNFPEVYKALNVDLSKLGCVMLDVAPISLDGVLAQDGASDFLQTYQGDLYYAQDKSRFWIDGFVGSKNAHLTLLYGLMETAENYRSYIEQILKDWKMADLEIESVGYFSSPYQDDQYFCIVGHVKVTPELLEGHQRLEFLPHINTFPGYKAHITLAYVKADENVRDHWINAFQSLVGKKLPVKEGLNLGGNK